MRLLKKVIGVMPNVAVQGLSYPAGTPFQPALRERGKGVGRTLSPLPVQIAPFVELVLIW